MDKFLQIFRDKVKKLKTPEMNQADWDDFVRFKNANSSTFQKSTNNYSMSKIAMIGAASLIGVVVFALFIVKQYNQKPDKFLNGKNGEYTFIDSVKSGKNTIIDTFNTENKNYSTQKTNNVVISEIKSNEDDISANNNYELKKYGKSFGSKQHIKTENTKNETGIAYNTGNSMNSETYQYKNDTIQKLVRYKNNKNNNNYSVPVKMSNDSSFSVDEPIFTEKLPASEMAYFSLQSKGLPDTTFLKMIVPEIKKVNENRFIISGKLAYIKPVNDRMDAENIFAKRISGSYYLSKRFRIGANYSFSSYRTTINKKEKYPYLDEVKPHHPDEFLEDIKLQASMKRIGIDASFDILRFNRFITTIGTGFQGEVSVNFDFKLNVRDRFGKHYFQDQQHEIIKKPRFFMSPYLGLEYQIFESFRISGEVQYELSLSEMHEKYLSFDAGVSYCF